MVKHCDSKNRRQEDHFETSRGYTVSPRPTHQTFGDPVLKENKNKKPFNHLQGMGGVDALTKYQTG